MRKRLNTSPLCMPDAAPCADADTDGLCRRIVAETTAMGYATAAQAADGGFRVRLTRDLNGIDLFLGRWQITELEVTRQGDALVTDIVARDRLDKVVCLLIGPLFLALPWVFGLIARANRRNIEAVVARMVADYATRLRTAESE